MTDVTFDQLIDRLFQILKDKRKVLGLTQGDLGAKIGKPQSAIARLESGNIKDPHISMIFQFCQALDIKPADLFAEAYGQIIAEVKPSKKDLEGKLEILRERVKLLEKGKKDALDEILDGVLKLM